MESNLLITVKEPCPVCRASGKTLAESSRGVTPHACPSCGGSKYTERDISLAAFLALLAEIDPKP